MGSEGLESGGWGRGGAVGGLHGVGVGGGVLGLKLP